MTSRDVRSYGHACMLARALERVGDRWTLLVVRDLLTGPKRFTDLMDRLAGITPKTLTQRLRDLEADGLVHVDRVAGRREVWYRLSPAGEDLGPALDELLLWGMRHVAEPPRPDEPVHPEHVLRALQVQLQHEGVDAGSVRWAVHVSTSDDYVLVGDGNRWDLCIAQGGEAIPDVTIAATRSALVRFLTAPPPRDHDPVDVEITGKPAAVRAFFKAIEVFPPVSLRTTPERSMARRLA